MKKVILLSLIIALLCASSCSSGTIVSNTASATVEVSANTSEASPEITEIKEKSYILLIGTHNKLEKENEEVQGITHMVICIDPNERKLRVMNLSMSVGLKEDSGKTVNICMFDNENGPEKTTKAIAELLGIPLFDYAALSVFTVPTIFDSMGTLKGINIEQSYINSMNEILSSLFDSLGASQQIQSAGEYDLNGMQTVAYFLSSPKGNTSMEEEREWIGARNSILLSALRKNIENLTFEQLLAIVNAVFTEKDGFRTNVSLDKWSEYIRDGLDCASNPVEYIEFPEKGKGYTVDGSGWNMTMDEAAIKEAASAFFGN